MTALRAEYGLWDSLKRHLAVCSRWFTLRHSAFRTPHSAFRTPQSAIRNRGQAAVETALAIPLLLLMMFGAFQVARIFWVYQTLHKAVRNGAGLLSRASNLNYCDQSDPMFLNVKNFIVYGNMQGIGDPLVTGLTIYYINFYPERIAADSTEVDDCTWSCGNPTNDVNSCDIAAGGRAPDFITVSLGPSGFPLEVLFPYVHWTTMNLKVSVRVPLTGG
jgi:hypothetical protein